MIKVENVETVGWEAAFRGMRNPMNSWGRSDSGTDSDYGLDSKCGFHVGPNDLDLACRLIKAGPEHRKFLRMIHVQMDITAPIFWWSEFDTYKIATTRNSCSKMHKIHVEPFTLSDFSHEGCSEIPYAIYSLSELMATCERLRNDFNTTKERKYWRALIELLPEGYNMKATWDGSMETVLNALYQRDGHKLREEWVPFREAMFDDIPYCEEFYSAMSKKENYND